MSQIDQTEEEVKVINFDKILLNEVGEFGRYQWKVVALSAVLFFLSGLANNEYLFTFAKVRTRCVIPECESKSSANLNFTPPWIFDAIPRTSSTFDNCHRYGNTSRIDDGSCSADIFDRNTTMACEEYVFEDKNSAIYEFNMACDDWRPHLLGSVNLFGMMLALPISGFISDRWGRRTIMGLSAVNIAWIGCLKYWAPSYTSYMVLGFLEIFIGAGSTTAAYILAIEYMGPEHRVMASATMTSCFALGHSIQGLVAWGKLYWRHLILIIKIPGFFVISYIWICPESARWLISKGRIEEAMAVVQQAAKCNGKMLTQETLTAFCVKNSTATDVVTKVSESGLIREVFKYKQMILRCVLTPIWWATLLFVYYGLTMSSVGIMGNKNLNFSAVSAVEIPGYWIAVLLLNTAGRRPMLLAGFWLCGMCQIGYILIPNGHYFLSLIVYLTGKLSISAVVTAIYVYTAELYPTRHRTSLLAYSSMVGRVGAILGPLAPALSAAIWEPLPFILFAGMAFLSGLLVLLAPETIGTMLPDTMEDAANLGKGTPCKIVDTMKRLLRRCFAVLSLQWVPTEDQRQVSGKIP